ncbi:MAG: Rrf2 family transcriptional regulator [Lachnospiraceae bacterium]|nr:Rrf2 family transcriptional regulator [Lachnospiraceae bacterium]
MISTKGRYALRVIVDLAEHQQGEEYIPLRDIAARQEISEKYLEIILKVLVKEKLLKGLRGKGGGYRLTREPKDYPVGEILRLTEGTLAPVACLTENAEPCARSASCSTIHMWQRFDSLVQDFFYTISIADLMDGGEQIK